MSEGLIGVLIGGVLTLAGTFLSSILQRNWAVADFRRQHRLSLVEKRIAMSESYVEAATQDFRQVMHDIEFYLFADDPVLVAQRRNARAQWKDSLDTRVFAKGPAMRALRDEPVIASWNGMMGALDKLRKVYAEITNAKSDRGEAIDAKAYRDSLEEIWLEYSKHLGALYARLDEIQLSRFE
jgi:hypothetical protein